MPPFPTVSVPVVSESAIPSDEVASAVGTALPPVAFAMMVLAACAARDVIGRLPEMFASVEVDDGTHVPAPVYVRTWPAVPAAKSEDVATAPGVPAPPVEFPRIELAAIDARAMVAFEPPMRYPFPADTVMPVPLPRV